MWYARQSTKMWIENRKKKEEKKNVKLLANSKILLLHAIYRENLFTVSFVITAPQAEEYEEKRLCVHHSLTDRSSLGKKRKLF